MFETVDIWGIVGALFLSKWASLIGHCMYTVFLSTLLQLLFLRGDLDLGLAFKDVVMGELQSMKDSGWRETLCFSMEWRLFGVKCNKNK